MPVTIRVSLVLALLAAVGLLVNGVVQSIPAPMQIRLVDAQGQPLKSCELEFFEYNDASWGPSPMPKFGAQSYAGLDGIVVFEGELPAEVIVKLRSAEHGVMFTTVSRGDQIKTVKFGQPQKMTGTVVLPDGKPASGGRVQVLLGGSRGLLLSELKTDEGGRFTAENFSSLTEVIETANGSEDGRSIGVRYLYVRVLVPGYEVAEWDRSVLDDSPFVIALVPTRPVLGKVSSEHDIDVSGLTLRCYGLPGVTSRTAADGSFQFDNLPGGYLRPTLFLPDLPSGYTQRMCKTQAGDQGVEIRVFRGATISGQVLNGNSRLPVVGAKVMHEHGPFGKQIVETDSNGEFEIPNVPPGVIEFVADILIRHDNGQAMVRGFDMRDQPSHIRRVVVQGSVSTKIDEGVDQEDIMILMY